MEKRLSKIDLLNDIVQIANRALKEKGYMFFAKDIFALGYMCGKYNLSRLIDNEKEVIATCLKYDEYDDLGLLDTIGETLIDLEVIKNDKGII